MVGGVEYLGIDSTGLRVSVPGAATGDPHQERRLAVDTVVICAGQESVRELESPLKEAGARCHVIGGAALAAELDAVRAIREATELAAQI